MVHNVKGALSHVKHAWYPSSLLTKRWRYLVSFWFGAIEMKYDLGFGKLSNLPWPFFQVVTINENNKHDFRFSTCHWTYILYLN